jgi:hypothetical protein
VSTIRPSGGGPQTVDIVCPDVDRLLICHRSEAVASPWSQPM